MSSCHIQLYQCITQVLTSLFKHNFELVRRYQTFIIEKIWTLTDIPTLTIGSVREVASVPVRTPARYTVPTRKLPWIICKKIDWFSKVQVCEMHEKSAWRRCSHWRKPSRFRKCSRLNIPLVEDQWRAVRGCLRWCECSQNARGCTLVAFRYCSGKLSVKQLLNLNIIRRELKNVRNTTFPVANVSPCFISPTEKNQLTPYTTV